MSDEFKVGPIGDIYNNNNEIVAVDFSDRDITITMCDGRRVSSPLAWYPWLASATSEQRQKFQVYARSIMWRELGDGMSIEPFLLGDPRTA